MRPGHFIALDTHCAFCEFAVVNGRGTLQGRDRCATTIEALRTRIEAVRDPGNW